MWKKYIFMTSLVLCVISCTNENTSSSPAVDKQSDEMPLSEEQALENIDVALCPSGYCIELVIDKYISLSESDITQPQDQISAYCESLDTQAFVLFCKTSFFNKLAVYRKDISLCVYSDQSQHDCIIELVNSLELQDLSVCSSVGMHESTEEVKADMQATCHEFVEKNINSD